MIALQIFALEEVNVRKAINRYGTLPKGARIGGMISQKSQSVFLHRMLNIACSVLGFYASRP